MKKITSLRRMRKITSKETPVAKLPAHRRQFARSLPIVVERLNVAVSGASAGEPEALARASELAHELCKGAYETGFLGIARAAEALASVLERSEEPLAHDHAVELHAILEHLAGTIPDVGPF